MNYMSAFIRNGIRYIFPDAKLYWLLERLTANLDIYVNVNTGDDSLAVIAGGTQANPFKTIQAAVNYVAENYFLGPWNVTINIANGTYYESIVLPKYQSTSGVVKFLGQNIDSTIISGERITANATPAPILITLPVLYHIRNLTLITPQNNNIIENHCVYVEHGTIRINNCVFIVKSGNNPAIPLAVHAGGEIDLGYTDGSSLGDNYLRQTSGSMLSVLWSASGSLIHLRSNFVLLNNISTSIGFCAAITLAGFIRNSITKPTISTNGFTAGGPRYYGQANGIIDTYGGGPNYFPGTTAGSLNTGAQYT